MWIELVSFLYALFVFSFGLICLGPATKEESKKYWSAWNGWIVVVGLSFSDMVLIILRLCFPG